MAPDTGVMRRANRPRTERLLLILAALFVGFYALLLTFSPGVRSRDMGEDLRWMQWLGFGVWLAGFVIAHREVKRRLPDRDPYLLPIAALLSGWGLMTIWRLFPDFGMRQTVWIAIALILLMMGMRLNSNLDFLRRYKYLWLTGGLSLTALTLIFGTNPLGAGPRLWLGCCGIYLQPSEPLKLLLIVYLAAYFADRLPFIMPALSDGSRKNGGKPSLLPLLAPTIIMAGLALLLLLVQRDLGTASIFLILYATIVFLATGDRRVLFLAALTLVLAGLAGYFAFDLVRLRIEAWINPWLDPSGRSYQIVQSLIAVANGGLIGRGPGMGNPGLVPIPHADFIFAAIGEEGGLLGGLGLLLILGVLANRGVKVAMGAEGVFHRYLAAGLVSYLIFQSVLIVGGNLRLLPLTGVTLPFVSYGGSSLVTSFISLLLLLHISSRSRPAATSSITLRPFFQLGGIQIAGIVFIALGLGWWAFVRGPDLLARTDNPRRTISDRFVPRGSILDRSNSPINVTLGAPGEYQRTYFYSGLSATAGYTDPVYGQSALEASMDPVLRGLEGNSGFTIWWNHLLYGQPPPGLDIRTTINLTLQENADQAMESHNGAVVLINPENGEILVLASQPSFDANHLEETWEDLIADSDAPLVNRATQALYPAGTALGPLLLAGVLDSTGVAPGDDELQAPELARTSCAIPIEGETWGDAVRAGCQGAVSDLGTLIGEERMAELYSAAGLFNAPSIQLPVESMSMPDRLGDPTEAAVGEGLRFSPLQIALALSALSSAGEVPAPLLVGAIDAPGLGWLPQSPLGSSRSVISPESAGETAMMLRDDQFPVWETASTGSDPGSDEDAVAWYTSGTLPEWAGAPLILVVLIEGEDAAAAQEIGHQLWEVTFSSGSDL